MLEKAHAGGALESLVRKTKRSALTPALSRKREREQEQRQNVPGYAPPSSRMFCPVR